MNKSGKEVLWARESQGSYVIQLVEETAWFSSYEIWHQALGHSSVSVLNRASASNIFSDSHLISNTPNNFHCNTCSLSKSIHHKPKDSTSKTKRAFELIHIDLSGKFSVPSISMRPYYITFIDDFTRYAWIAFLAKKSDAKDAIKNVIHGTERQHSNTSGTILRFHNYNGGEYITDELKAYYESVGIAIEYTPPYSHKLNGVAERFNRIIVTMMRSMMMDMDSKFLWAEAAATAGYVKNRLLHVALSNDITLFEALNGHNLTIKHLQPFGRVCFMHIPVESRPPGSKLLARSIEGRFCGYTKSTKIYHIWIPSKPNQVYESRDITFPPIRSDKLTLQIDIHQPLEGSTVEPTVNSPPHVPETDSDSERLTPIEDLDSENRILQQSISEESFSDQFISHQQQQMPPHPRAPSPHIRMPGSFTDTTTNDIPPTRKPAQLPNPPLTLCRGNRIWKATERYGFRTNAATIVIPNKPVTYRQATSDNDTDLWQVAMDDEIQSLKVNGTWEEMDPPAGRRIVDSKWVYKIKQKEDGSIERYKAHVVVKGFSQQFGSDYEEKLAPVARYDSFKLLLAIAAYKGWKPQQMDVKTAFLYGTLKEEIYMRLPKGYRT